MQQESVIFQIAHMFCGDKFLSPNRRPVDPLGSRCGACQVHTEVSVESGRLLSGVGEATELCLGVLRGAVEWSPSPPHTYPWLYLGNILSPKSSRRSVLSFYLSSLLMCRILSRWTLRRSALICCLSCSLLVFSETWCLVASFLVNPAFRFIPLLGMILCCSLSRRVLFLVFCALSRWSLIRSIFSCSVSCSLLILDVSRRLLMSTLDHVPHRFLLLPGMPPARKNIRSSRPISANPNQSIVFGENGVNRPVFK